MNLQISQVNRETTSSPCQYMRVLTEAVTGEEREQPIPSGLLEQWLDTIRQNSALLSTFGLRHYEYELTLNADTMTPEVEHLYIFNFADTTLQHLAAGQSRTDDWRRLLNETEQGKIIAKKASGWRSVERAAVTKDINKQPIVELRNWDYSSLVQFINAGKFTDKRAAITVFKNFAKVIVLVAEAALTRECRGSFDRPFVGRLRSGEESSAMLSAVVSKVDIGFTDYAGVLERKIHKTENSYLSKAARREIDAAQHSSQSCPISTDNQRVTIGVSTQPFNLTIDLAQMLSAVKKLHFALE